MKVKKFNEHTKWSTYNVTDAKNILKNLFIDYLNPTPDSLLYGLEPAKIEIEKIRHEVMACWTIKIPINIKGKINDITDKLDTIFKDLNHRLKYLDDEFDGLHHEIKLKDGYLSLSLWVD